MKFLANLLVAILALPAALLAPGTSGSASPEFRPSAAAIEQAVILAHSRAREAGGRPGPIRVGG